MTRTVYENEWFRVEESDHADGNGKPFFRVHHPDNAVILAFTEDDKMILVRQHRWALDDWSLEPPGGHVDPGEAPEASAAREMLEETGYRPGLLLSLGSGRIYTNRLGHLDHFFLATRSRRDPNASPEAGIEIVLADREGFSDLCRNGTMNQTGIFAMLKLAEMRFGIHWP